MNDFSPGVRGLMTQSNQYLVLQLIQRRGPISRKDIIQLSRLSSAAVSNITGELIQRGLVHEVGEADGEGRVGRPAILLRLNPHAGYVVGVKFAMSTIACVLTDLDASILYSVDIPLPFADKAGQTPAPFDPDVTIATVIQAVETVLARAQIDPVRLLGMGVGVSGIVDAGTGISRYAPNFGWRDVPIAAPLAAHFSIPVYVENDARTLTIAEQWFGAGRGVDHFVAVAVGQGIGAGVVANGQVYRGALGGAGEFGHIVFQLDGPLCSCGKRGCLEALASAPAILREIQEALAAGEPSTLVDAVPMTLDAVTRAADAGDELAQRVLATAGRWLGVGLTSLVNILNPQLLIINDEAVGGGRWYFEPMETALRTHAFDGLADSLRIMIEPGGNEIWARGAACVVLSALFTATVHQHDAVPLRALRVSARS